MPDSRYFLMCLLLIGFIGICSSGHAQSANKNKDCPSVDLKVSITKSSDGSTAEVEASGATAPVYYIFFYPSGVLVDKDRDVSKNKISGLKPGDYVCSIKDAKGCKKKIEFKVD